MRTLDVMPELKMARVEVLGQPSKRESLVLAIKVALQHSQPHRAFVSVFLEACFNVLSPCQ